MNCWRLPEELLRFKHMFYRTLKEETPMKLFGPHRSIVSGMVLAALLATTSACYGPFNLTRSVGPAGFRYAARSSPSPSAAR